jgi:hypothetical protein
MMSFFRYFGALFSFALALAAFAIFDYGRLENSSSQYIFLAATILFFVSAIILFFVKREGISRSLKFAFYLAAILAAGDFGYLKWKSQNALNKALNAKICCESIFADLFVDSFDGFTHKVQDTCRLRKLHEVLATLGLDSAEDRVILVTKLLQNQNRLNETSLVVMLSTYSGLESKRNEKDADHSLANNVGKEFSLLEGDLLVLQVYEVKPLFGAKLSPNMEIPRVKKMLELSMLGKTLTIMIERTRKDLGFFEALSKQKPSDAHLDSGELSLLEIRAQKLKEGYNRVIEHWNLPAQLESLNINQTYPNEYEKVRSDIDVTPL